MQIGISYIQIDKNDPPSPEGWNSDYEYMELENVSFDLTRQRPDILSMLYISYHVEHFNRSLSRKIKLMIETITTFMISCQIAGSCYIVNASSWLGPLHLVQVSPSFHYNIFTCSRFCILFPPDPGSAIISLQ